MKLFILFVMATFFAGIYFWDKRPRSRNVALLLLCLFVAFAYLFLDQI
jgi:hypothetical protein